MSASPTTAGSSAAQAAHVDLFLCETMLSAAEARAAATAARESGRPVWTALSVDDADGTRLRSGEGVADGARAAVDAGAEAVLINCSSPEAVTTAVPLLAGIGVPFGAYANGFVSVGALQPGKTVEVLEARDDLDPARYAGHALAWVAAGATIVGGCCEIGPAHIAALGQRLVAGGHELVFRSATLSGTAAARNAGQRRRHGEAQHIQRRRSCRSPGGGDRAGRLCDRAGASRSGDPCAALGRAGPASGGDGDRRPRRFFRAEDEALRRAALALPDDPRHGRPSARAGDRRPRARGRTARAIGSITPGSCTSNPARPRRRCTAIPASIPSRTPRRR